jgi:hypothetical protein
MMRQGFVLVLAGLVTGCAVGPGECTYESRGLDFRVDLSGIVHGVPDSGVASLQLAETSGRLSYRILTAGVQTWLAGAIADVRLLNTIESGCGEGSGPGKSNQHPAGLRIHRHPLDDDGGRSRIRQLERQRITRKNMDVGGKPELTPPAARLVQFAGVSRDGDFDLMCNHRPVLQESADHALP